MMISADVLVIKLFWQRLCRTESVSPVDLEWASHLSFFFFSVVLELELRAYTLSTPPTLFCVGFFRDGVSGTLCLGWLQTSVLLLSAS
jgi:hypothetical protein